MPNSEFMRRAARASLIALALCTLGDAESASSQAASDRTSPYRAKRALLIAAERYRSPYWDDLQSANGAWRVACALRQLCFDVELVVDSADAARSECAVRTAVAPVCADEPSFVVSQVAAIDAAYLSSKIRAFTTDSSLPDASAQLVWFGGHGTTQQTAWAVEGREVVAPQEGLLVGAGAPAPDHAGFLSHVVPLRELGTWGRLSRAQHLLFALESCFSGTVFEFRPEVRPFSSWSALLRLPVRQFVTAGGAGQPIPENSAFAERFAQAVLGQWGCDPSQPGCDPDAPKSDHGAYRDGVLTASELGRLLNVELGNQSGGRQTPQWGALLDQRFDKGEFLFPVPFRFARDPAAGAFDGQSALIPVRHCDRCPEVVALSANTSIGAREISFAEWEECVDAGSCRQRPDDAGWGGGRQPVIRVSLTDVSEYLAWLNARVEVGFAYRLPTAAEWRDAAERFREQPVNCVGCDPRGAMRPLPAGWAAARSEAPTLAPQDLIGNLWEWIAVCEDGSTASIGRADGAPPCSNGGEPRASVVGGSWANGPDLAHAASERAVASTLRSSGVGFRVAIDRLRPSEQ